MRRISMHVWYTNRSKQTARPVTWVSGRAQSPWIRARLECGGWLYFFRRAD